MEVKGIKETSLYVKNLEISRQFYQDKLGFKVIANESGRHVFLRAGYTILLLFNPEVTGKKNGLPPHHGKGNLHLAFEVRKEDYENAKRQILAAGIEIEHEEHWFEDVFSFYFRDPDGHSLEIIPEGLWERNG